LRPTSRRLVVATAGLAVLLAVPVAIGLWHRKVVPWVERRLEQTIGRPVRVDSLAIGGLRTLIARGVEVFGAPPFDSEPVARAERIAVRLGGPGRGFWEPADVTVDGLDVEYLSTGAVDNLRNRPSTAVANGRHPLGNGPVAIRVQGARVRGVMALPGGIRVVFRSPDVTFVRSLQGIEVASVKNLVVEIGSVATLRLPELSLSRSQGMPLVANSRHASLEIPGGGVLVDEALVLARFSAQGSSVKLNTGVPDSHGLSISFRTETDMMDLHLEARQLPLRALAVLTNPRGIGLEEASLDLTIVASYDREQQRVPFRVDSIFHGIEVHHPAVDRQRWSNLGLEVHTTGQFAPGTGRIDIESSELRALGAQLNVKGWAELLGTPRGEITIHTPAPLLCADLLAAQAQPVRQVLDGLSLGGKLGGFASLSFDAAAWETLTLDVRVNPRCKVKTEPQVLASLAPALLQGAPVGPLAPHLPLGKYHPDFASLSEMPQHLPAAFLTSEDSHFYSHSGFDLEMIRHALVQDLETRSFGRGASTITQQLAKNLLLNPSRTLARKLEETVLAWRLHNLVSKDRILELYLNVIDLGPGIRGVRQASRAYFGKELQQLRPIESAYLAALTPNPHVLARRFRDGHVDDGWVQRLYDLLGMMKRSGRLTAAELAAARTTKLVLRKPGDVPKN
jgi:hypothetical protein